jgi:Domain of unknown function (DUF4114)
MTRTLALGFAAAVVATAPRALSLQQPDGKVIPETTKLINILNAQGETIMPLGDAAVTPERFKPLCALTFKVLSRGGSQHNSFGWYNASGQKPALNDLYEFIACNDNVPVVKVLDLRNDPRYLGGEIGFFLATTEGASGNCVNFADFPKTLGHLFFSERAYNDDNNAVGPSYTHLLIMDSKATPSAFYFAWEDKYQGNDNDFDDLLTRVDGIECSGGGDPCNTGLEGICITGATACVNGKLACVPRRKGEPEKCNGLDDDCNGQVDDGKLCGPTEICDRGRCVEGCGRGEFQCAANLICDNAFCVEVACKGIACPAGEVCFGGQCRGACDKIVCPFGQECRAGRCVGPCEAIKCETGQACENGICVSCGCGGCPGAKVCSAEGNRCVESGCETTVCLAGRHCIAGGTCADDCAGVLCPGGTECWAGRCADMVDASADAARPPPVVFLEADASTDAAGAFLEVGGVEAGATGSSVPRGRAVDQAGCGCRSAQGGSHRLGSWWAGLLALGVAARRTTRRARTVAQRVGGKT